MRLAIPMAIAAAMLSVNVSAQDTTVKSQTRITADDAKVVGMSGCLRQVLGTDLYRLDGAMVATGDDLKTTSTVKTDVDRDKTTVKGKTETKADGSVATSGTVASYALIPGNNVNLASHVGEQVQISAIVVERGHGDADVTIKEQTKVDPDDARDSKGQTKTKLELPRSSADQYTVMTLTTLGTTCAK